MPLAEFPENVNKGNYEYPFHCIIPSGLPGSVSARTGRSHCKIVYSLEACLHRAGWSTWDVQHAKEFTVAPSPAAEQTAPLYLEPQFVDVKTCFCYNRGRMVTGGAATNSILGTGETMRLNYAVQNESTALIEAIEISLYERVTWRAGSRSRSSTRALFKSKLSALSANNQTKLEDLYLLPTAKKDQVASPEDDAGQLRIIKRMLDSRKYCIDVPIDMSARKSYVGTLIDTKHWVSIVVRTSMGTANPEMTHPIYIVSRPAVTVGYQMATAIGCEPLDAFDEASKGSEVPSLPPSWNATQSPVYTVPVSYYATTAVETDGPESGDGAYFEPALLNPSAPPLAMAYSAGQGIDSLLGSLKVSIDPVGEVTKWVEASAVDLLVPQDFYRIFCALPQPYHQTMVADVLSRKITEISCMSLAEAARGSAEYCRREVVENLLNSTKILDIENKELVKAKLSEFQFMCIEHYFRVG